MNANDSLVAVRESESGYQIELSGSLDLEAASALYKDASPAANSGQPVVIEWAGAGHAGAAALQVLLALRAATSACGAPLCCGKPSESLTQTLALSGAISMLSSGTGGIESKIEPDVPAGR